jgi:hypothetical protein
MIQAAKQSVIVEIHEILTRGAWTIGLWLLTGILLVSAVHANVLWNRRILPGPNQGKQQTCCLVLDIDRDGVDDFVIGERTQAPSVVWYKYRGGVWEQYVIDDTRLRPEAGGDFGDIDRDGDLDIIFGQDSSGNEIWWWENPYPDYNKPWTRRIIKQSGANQHHDQAVGDFDGDDRVEFVTWNQRAKELLLFEIPADPRSAESWSSTVIYSWSSGNSHEGFPAAPVDIDLDDKLDIVGGGRWFKHIDGADYQENVIDDGMRFTQCAAGQLVKGGRPEVVFSPGDADGDAKWYGWDGSEWIGHKLRYVIHGHTCEVGDIDGDGNLDIMVGEMGKPGAGDEAKIFVWYGDGQGNFRETVASYGQGIHEGKLGDLDGDGDLDILLKPYSHNTPRVDILLNAGSADLSSAKWQTHLIDDLPARAVFVTAGDIDGDGHRDLIAGAWWWRNPGDLSHSWERHSISDRLKNMAIVDDFDGDGDLDILGTEGAGSEANHNFVWAENDGRGNFTPHYNVDSGGTGDFLQGCATVDLETGRQIALSWHNGGGGVQALSIPDNPAQAPWKFVTLSETTQKEDLSAADIDGDGDVDILLGVRWLRNDGGEWTNLVLGEVTAGEPDRNALADVNGDGRLDAVVSLENGTDVLWFEAPEDRTQKWFRHTIGTIAGQGFSMDTADFDSDGDPDVVLGEHRGETENRVVIFENLNAGTSWKEHIIDSGPKNIVDHHDGTQAMDIDGDGDIDIISIGWYNPKLWVYERR